MKKKPVVLRVLAALTALVLIFLLATSLLDIYENPIMKRQLKDDFQAYMEEHLPWVKDDYTCGDVSYNGKFDTYFVTCEYKTQTLLSFSIERTRDGEMYDTYKFNIEDGANLLAMLSNEIYNDVLARYGDQVALLADCNIRVDEPLHSLDKDIQEALRKNQRVHELPIYSLYYYGGEQSADYEQGVFVQERLRKLKKASEETDFVPISYGASFFDETGNTGYDLIGVRVDVMERADFPEMVEEVKLEPQKYKAEYGFERINFEEK